MTNRLRIAPRRFPVKKKRFAPWVVRSTYPDLFKFFPTSPRPSVGQCSIPQQTDNTERKKRGSGGGLKCEEIQTPHSSTIASHLDSLLMLLLLLDQIAQERAPANGNIIAVSACAPFDNDNFILLCSTDPSAHHCFF